MIGSKLVSIIVPIYNASDYMYLCIESVINQTYQNLEIILVNDGSTDGSGKICETYANSDNRIRLVHQMNAGPGVARNHGIDVAEGEFLCFADSDDCLASDAVEKMLIAMDEQCDLVQCRAEKKYKDEMSDDEPWPAHQITFGRTEAMINYLMDSKPIVRFSVWAKLIRKKAIGDLRFPDMSYSEDVVFNAYLIDRCRKIRYIPDVLYYVNMRGESLSRGKLTDKKINARIRCCNEIIAFAESRSEFHAYLPRTYWTKLAAIIFMACEVYTQKENNWHAIVIGLQKNAIEMKIPRKLFGIRQRITYSLFRKYTVAFVVLLSCFSRIRSLKNNRNG